MLRGKLFDYYVSKKGNDVFKYALTGTPEELALYEASQTVVHLQEGTDSPIFFSPRHGGNNIEIDFTKTTGKPFIKNTQERGVLNVINQNAANAYGQAMATEYAKIQLAALLGTGVQAVTKAKKAAPVKDEEQDEQVEDFSGALENPADDLQNG